MIDLKLLEERHFSGLYVGSVGSKCPRAVREMLFRQQDRERLHQNARFVSASLFSPLEPTVTNQLASIFPNGMGLAYDGTSPLAGRRNTCSL